MSKPITAVATPFQEIVIVCGKCKGSGKLRAALKGALREGGRRQQVRVVEGGCFGLCPKKAVTVAASRAPGELLVVPAKIDGTQALRRISPEALPLP
jgi:hypothetical protein